MSDTDKSSKTRTEPSSSRYESISSSELSADQFLCFAGVTSKKSVILLLDRQTLVHPLICYRLNASQVVIFQNLGDRRQVKNRSISF